MIKDSEIKIRLSSRMKALYQKEAKRKGEDLSKYIRKSMIMRKRSKSADDLALLISLRSEINSLGSNVNQILKRFNQIGHISESDAECIKDAYDMMKSAVQHALKNSR